MNCKECGNTVDMLHGESCTDCEQEYWRKDAGLKMMVHGEVEHTFSSANYRDLELITVEHIKKTFDEMSKKLKPVTVNNRFGKDFAVSGDVVVGYFPLPEEKPRLSHYADAKVDDTREVDGVTWRVVKVEDDTTVWWGKGAYAKMEVCCPPLPPRDESYGRKLKADVPLGNTFRLLPHLSVYPFRSYTRPIRFKKDTK